MDKNILFILEGSRSEPRFLRKLIERTRDGRNYNVFPFNTNIHRMLEGIFDGEEIDVDLDFLEYLRSCPTVKDDESVLERRFVDIYLIFDMDPQDQGYDPERLKKALKYFDDSTENGKLYINYPMLESYRHIGNLDDDSYLDLSVAVNDIGNYKQIAARDGTAIPSDINRIDAETWSKIIELNLRKANRITTDDGSIPDRVSYERCLDQSNIFGAERKMLESEQRISVLNTSVFNVVDYNPGRYLT